MEKKIFENMAEQGIQDIPAQFLEKLNNVAIVIEDEPNNQQLEKTNIAKGRTLLGLYEGVPQTRRWHYSFTLPDKITIFQGPIERAAGNDPQKIRQIVKDTVWHEITHHFGMDENTVRKAARKRKNKK